MDETQMENVVKWIGVGLLVLVVIVVGLVAESRCQTAPAKPAPATPQLSTRSLSDTTKLALLQAKRKYDAVAGQMLQIEKKGRDLQMQINDLQQQYNQLQAQGKPLAEELDKQVGLAITEGGGDKAKDGLDWETMKIVPMPAAPPAEQKAATPPEPK
jgi:TolA-binding protein